MTYCFAEDIELAKELNIDRLKEWVKMNKSHIIKLEQAVGIPPVKRKRLNFAYSTGTVGDK